MKNRVLLVIACVIGFVGGLAVALTSGVVSGAGHAHTPSTSQFRVHPQSHVPLGATPAAISAIVDNHCVSFSVSGSAPPTVLPNDPRFKPCMPTASHFSVEWASPPTQAQLNALQNVMGNLALNHPTISLAQADPIIRAAVQNAH